MNILVDADACPVVIRDILYRAAQKRQIALTLFANQSFHIPQSNFITLYQVAQGPDVADHEISRRVVAGDLVITADIPLAYEVLQQDAHAMTPRGSDIPPIRFASACKCAISWRQCALPGNIRGGRRRCLRQIENYLPINWIDCYGMGCPSREVFSAYSALWRAQVATHSMMSASRLSRSASSSLMVLLATLTPALSTDCGSPLSSGCHCGNAFPSLSRL